MNIKFYKCSKCGQVVAKVVDSNVPITCCGEEMLELVPRFIEREGNEKHVPKLSIYKKKIIVKVGETLHPFTETHYISWIMVVSNKGVQVKEIKRGEEPIATFNLMKGEKVLEVFSYCNLHGLWKTDNPDCLIGGCPFFRK